MQKDNSGRVCRAAIESLTEIDLANLSVFCKNSCRKFLTRSMVDPSLNETLVQKAIVKVLNGEDALLNGHATIRNGRIQLKDSIKNSDVRGKYIQGIRHWNPAKHDMITFLQLVIVSEIRNMMQKPSPTVEYFDDIQSSKNEVASPFYERVEQREDISAYIMSIESAELRGFAQDILIREKQKIDLQLDYGLTRSQVDKRIKKLLDAAVLFSSRH